MTFMRCVSFVTWCAFVSNCMNRYNYVIYNYRFIFQTGFQLHEQIISFVNINEKKKKNKHSEIVYPFIIFTNRLSDWVWMERRLKTGIKPYNEMSWCIAYTMCMNFNHEHLCSLISIAFILMCVHAFIKDTVYR